MAAVAGVSKAGVQRIWAAHGIKPHLVFQPWRQSDPVGISS
jgi:hypothetical protein